MPRSYFDASDSETYTEDHEGQEHDGIVAVRTEALYKPCAS